MRDSQDSTDIGTNDTTPRLVVEGFSELQIYHYGQSICNACCPHEKSSMSRRCLTVVVWVAQHHCIGLFESSKTWREKSVAESVCFSTPHKVALASNIWTKFLAFTIDSLLGSVFNLLSASATILDKLGNVLFGYQSPPHYTISVEVGTSKIFIISIHQYFVTK